MSRQPRASILICEDSRLLAEALAQSIERTGRWRILGTVLNGKDLQDNVRKLQPDLLLLDIVLPEVNALELVKEIANTHPGTKILGVSSVEDPAVIHQFIVSGGSGFISKGASTDDLIRAIEMTFEGQVFLPPQMANLMSSFRRGDGVLSPRESEVLRLIADGLSSSEIGGKLDLSSKTIETHRQRIMVKLDAYSTADLIKAAIRLGLTQI